MEPLLPLRFHILLEFLSHRKSPCLSVWMFSCVSLWSHLHCELSVFHFHINQPWLSSSVRTCLLPVLSTPAGHGRLPLIWLCHKFHLMKREWFLLLLAWSCSRILAKWWSRMGFVNKYIFTLWRKNINWNCILIWSELDLNRTVCLEYIGLNEIQYILISIWPVFLIRCLVVNMSFWIDTNLKAWLLIATVC